MSPVPFLGEVPPYRLVLGCSGSLQKGVQLHLRLETRVAFQLPYELRADIYQEPAVGAEELAVIVHIHGLQPAKYGHSGNRPAALEWSGLFPAGSLYGRCTLRVGKREQHFLLRFTPPQLELVQQYGSPLAELVVL